MLYYPEHTESSYKLIEEVYRKIDEEYEQTVPKGEAQRAHKQYLKVESNKMFH